MHFEIKDPERYGVLIFKQTPIEKGCFKFYNLKLIKDLREEEIRIISRFHTTALKKDLVKRLSEKNFEFKDLTDMVYNLLKPLFNNLKFVIIPGVSEETFKKEHKKLGFNEHVHCDIRNGIIQFLAFVPWSQ